MAGKRMGLVAAMVLAVGFIAVLAYWDEERASELALEDFAQHQTLTASLMAQHLKQRLLEVRRDARMASEAIAKGDAPSPSLTEIYGALAVRPSDGLRALTSRGGHAFSIAFPVSGEQSVAIDLSLGDLLSIRADRPSETALLVLPPDQATFRTEDGRNVEFAELGHALDEGRASMRVDRSQAARLGLPERTAMAGLARVDTGLMGRWGIAVISSAERERDREYHARARLLLAVLGAAGLVVSFGGVALVNQKKELELERTLEIRDVEQERDERLKALDKAVTLGTMAIGIAHEVSTPLGVISGRAEQILSRAGEDERLSRAARSVLEQTQRINEVIRAFLRIARGDPAPIQPIGPKALVESALLLVEHRFEKSGVHLNHDVAENLSEVQGDRVLLEQALVNLLLNACEACERGGHVEVSARNSGATIAITVLDDGSGISTEAAQRAEELFFTTKGDRGGTGLGLAIVGEIVKHHSGRFVITPRIPRGTSARIEIPIWDVQSGPRSASPV